MSRIQLVQLIILIAIAVLGLTRPASATYEIAAGRWIERDPPGYVDGANRYQYAISSPVLMVDPRGLSSCSGGSSDGDACSAAGGGGQPGSGIQIGAGDAVGEAVHSGGTGHVGSHDAYFNKRRSIERCTKCCEVRVFASPAFGTGFSHLCFESGVPDDGGGCTTVQGELGPASIRGGPFPIGQGPLGGMLGSAGSASGGSAGDSSLENFGGNANLAWGIYVKDGGRCRVSRATGAANVVPANGDTSSAAQCELARCMKRKAIEIARNAAANEEGYRALDQNSNSFVGQVIRECGGKITGDLAENAPGFGNNFSRHGGP